MPNNRVKTSKALQSKKGKASLSKLHPHSRRAKQLARVNLRTDKLRGEKKERRRVEISTVDRLLWFCNALDPALPSLTLPAVHSLIADFLARHDDDLAEERRARREGRNKSAKQEKLEAEKAREEEEYRNGMIVPDFTSPQAVILLRQWAGYHSGDPSFYPRLRLIRTSATEPDAFKVEQEGAADRVTLEAPFEEEEDPEEGETEVMGDVEEGEGREEAVDGEQMET